MPSDFTPSFTPDDFTPTDLRDFFVVYLRKKHIEDIREIMQDENNHVAQYGLPIGLDSITNDSMAIGTMLLHFPQKLIFHCNEAIQIVQEKLKEEENLPTKLINARLENVPPLPEVFKMAVSDLRNYNISRLVLLQGTIVRTSSPSVVEYEKKYKCFTCEKEFIMYAEIDSDMAIETPSKCTTPKCTGKKFKEIYNRCKDIQEIKIQDKVTHLQVGRIPRSMSCHIEDDLVDSCKPGDDVEVTGYLLRHWRNFRSGEFVRFDTIFQAINIRVVNQTKVGDWSNEKGKKKIKEHWEKYRTQPLKGRDVILKSVCPRLYGMWRVKMALLLALIGGVSKVKGQTRIRGESHILLVGDPGTGKSQLLKFAVSVARRNVFTSGTGTSSAGLTVMATKDSGGAWVLEAGALVLADGGVCCIDEFSGISEYDRATIHEAMEQQTLSIAKAGLVCKLNTRCTIVAACNPKAKFDKNASLTANTTLASPLLSRFDIIIVLPDTQDENWDKQIADYILNERELEDEEHGERWSFQDLKSYISHVKQIQPTLNSEAVEILKAYYNYQRTHSTDQSQITVRFLESLIRISQAHARLMHRKEVTEQDAIMGMIAIDTSKNFLVDEGKMVLHENFPENPDDWYETQREFVLQRLGIKDSFDINFHRGPSTLPRDYEPKIQANITNSKFSIPNVDSDSDDFIDHENQIRFNNFKARIQNNRNTNAIESRNQSNIQHNQNQTHSSDNQVNHHMSQNLEQSKDGPSQNLEYSNSMEEIEALITGLM